MTEMERSNKKLVVGVFLTLICLVAALLGASLKHISFRDEQENPAKSKGTVAEIAQGEEVMVQRESVSTFSEAEEVIVQRESVSAISEECESLRGLVSRSQSFMQSFESEIELFSQKAAQVKNLDDIRLAASQYIVAIENLAIELDQLSNRLKANSITDETLNQFRNDYTDVIQGFSQAIQRAGKAMKSVASVKSEAELPKKIEQSQQQTMSAIAPIDKYDDEEYRLILNMNIYCKDANR
jgi:ferritin-like metal-binding protein YciE